MFSSVGVHCSVGVVGLCPLYKFSPTSFISPKGLTGFSLAHRSLHKAMEGEPPKLLLATALIVQRFKEIAKEDDKISKGELRTLLQEEFQSKLGNKEVDKFMESLDADGDNSVNFMEYIAFIGSLALSIHDMK
ncbi:hypothetical protein JZ751_000166 [Albula glossodonta]|uniref:EF-hand domain-containing protein n=1 Tax=Albula glossodonta TaxID=121402 RepID=A0A8T2PVM6_9TELE|nr:hypothetical protein JZ751_000166 [Albula glossodonta]